MKNEKWHKSMLANILKKKKCKWIIEDEEIGNTNITLLPTKES